MNKQRFTRPLRRTLIAIALPAGALAGTSAWAPGPCHCSITSTAFTGCSTTTPTFCLSAGTGGMGSTLNGSAPRGHPANSRRAALNPARTRPQPSTVAGVRLWLHQ